MLSVIYVSTVSGAMTNAEVEALAEQAAAFNAACGVTGMLAYNTLSFIQLLEGEDDDVLAIMRNIEADTRHNSINLIRKQERSARECPDWSMRPIFVPLTASGAASVFTGTLPETMELDTKILFTSFASQLTISQAAANAQAHHEAEQASTQTAAGNT